MKAILITIAAASVALAAAAPAIAQPSALSDSFAVPVAYADLNLKNPTAARVLERRIKNGSRLACGVRALDNMNQWDNIETCQQRFVSNARQQVQEAVRANAG